MRTFLPIPNSAEPLFGSHLAGAGAFLSIGRHPIAGLSGVLTEMTNDAIHLLNPVIRLI
jgi:hypothetical protein